MNNNSIFISAKDKNIALTAITPADTPIMNAPIVNYPTYSCISGPNNPKTIKRKEYGQSVMFDERVVVHSVPQWDPSRTQTFIDSSLTNQKLCNCCVIV